MRKIYILLIIMALIFTGLQAQVRGVISDNSGSLTGATVQVKGTTIGTISDIDGKYAIQATSGDILVYTFVGYEPQEITFNGDNSIIDVIMLTDSKLMGELVVVGYGTQKRSDLTGSLTVVDVGEIEKMQAPNIGQALQGLAPGVSVTSSGSPGGGTDIRIRGVGSYSNVSPLYVIDGMIINGSQRELNMNDVESVQVLKDASATALYGSRGANGVIIVTTKKGKEGPVKVDFSGSYGVQQIAKRMDMMNSLDFLRLNRSAYENAGEIWPGEPNQGDTLINTDWQDEFFQLGTVQDYNLTLSGGSKSGSYLVSGNAYLQDGVVLGPSHDRYTFRVNTSMKKGILTFGENFNFGRSNTKTLSGSPFIDLCRMPPIIPVYDDNNESGYGYGSGSYPTYGTNPVGAQNTRNIDQTSNRIVGNIFAELDLFKGFKYRLNFGFEYHNWHDRNTNTLDQIRYLQSEKYDNSYSETRGDFSTYIMDNLFTYNNKFGKHSIDGLFGLTAESTHWQQMSASVYDIIEPYWVLDSGNTDSSVGGSKSTRKLLSILGRINYSYDNKYLVQFNVRRDGTSIFYDEDYWYGTFPSASFGWRLSEESFMSFTENYIDNLKFRVSYGLVGNQSSISQAYPTSAFIYTNEGAIFGSNQQFMRGGIQKGQANRDLKWEDKTTFNIGLDFNVLRNSVYGSVEYYLSKSEDLLVQIPIAWTEGSDITPWTNYGAINNSGVEVSLGYRKQQGDFKYDMSLNLAVPRTEVMELGDTYREGGLNNVNRSEVGRSVGDFYVIRTDGIFQSIDEVYAYSVDTEDPNTGAISTQLIQPNAQPGDIRYKDLNSDGIINDLDREYVGSPFPKYEGGLNFSASYNNFDFSLFFYGVYGNQIFNNMRFWLERMDEPSNYPSGLQPWTFENHSNTTPRAYIGPNDNAKANTDRWIEDGSYIRLKNIQLGYNVPVKMLFDKLETFDRCRVYVSAENLFTMTNYSGYDPEISGGSVFGKGIDNGHFPPVRTFRFGLNLSF